MAVLAERPAAPAMEGLTGHGRTCDDALSELWVALTAEKAVACPLCAGRMEPRLSAAAGVVGGRCRGCGTEMS